MCFYFKLKQIFLFSISPHVFSPTCLMLSDLFTHLTPVDPNSRLFSRFWLYTFLYFFFSLSYLCISAQYFSSFQRYLNLYLLATQTTFVLLQLCVFFIFLYAYFKEILREKELFVWSLSHFERKLEVIAKWVLIKKSKEKYVY